MEVPTALRAANSMGKRMRYHGNGRVAPVLCTGSRRPASHQRGSFSVDAGVDPGVDPGVGPGVEPGFEPGFDTGTEPREG